MKTYVVIPQYLINDHLVKLSQNAIRSFKKTADCTVISVDDGGDRGQDMLKKESDVYLKNEKNSGFAPTCNKGFKWIQKHEKDDCNIVCANNDIEVFEGWLEEFEKVMSQFEGSMVGGLGFKGRVVEGKHISEYKTNPGSYYAWNSITRGGTLNDWLFPGGFYMTRKSVLDENGLYDEGFIHGGYEDIDLFQRIKQNGGNLLMTPKVAYWHEEGATRFGEEEKGHQNEAEPKNLAYYISKWGYNPHQRLGEIFKSEQINL